MPSLETIVRNVFGVWTGAVTPEEYVFGVGIFFATWVLLAHAGFWATGVKELEKLRNLIAAAGVIVALGPVAIPVVVSVLAYRHFFPPPKKEKKPTSSTAQV